MAGDVYDAPQHRGRGGWSWYTGSAGWMYRAGLESILGLRRTGQTFALSPCVPPTWGAFSITWQHGRTRYEIEVTNPDHQDRGIASATLDGQPVPPTAIPLTDDGQTHHVRMVMGH